MCSLLQTNPEDDQNPHIRTTGKLLTLTYRRSDASAMPPNPAFLAKRLKEKFPAVTSIMPHKHKTSLFIDVHDEDSYAALLRTTEVDDIPVTIRETNNELITSKGTIDLSILPNMSESDIFEETKNQGVLEVRQIVHTSKSNNKSFPTNLFVITFNTKEPPQKLKVDHLSLHVESRTPNPLRCFGCQWYGHTANQCLRDPICARCSQPGHDSKNCQEPPLCFHCRSDHPTYDRTCPMYRIEKLILEKRFREKITFKEARKEVYSAHPDLTHKIPRLTQIPHPQPPEKRVSQSGMTYSQAASPKPEVSKDVQTMIEALIDTVDKQQKQIELLISELCQMKTTILGTTQGSFPKSKVDAETQTKPKHCEMETQTPSRQTETTDASTETSHQTDIQPWQLSFLKETKVDETLPLESSHLDYSDCTDEHKNNQESVNKRKCISPIECPRQEDYCLSPCIGIDHSVISEELYDEYQADESPYHEETSSPPNQKDDEDTDTTDGHPEREVQQETHKLDIKVDPKVNAPTLLQAYFFSKDLADKMNATEIRDTFNWQQGNRNVACSVSQLKYPYGGHYIYFHTHELHESRLKLPYECTILWGVRVTLERPRKIIDRFCDCTGTS